MGNLSNEQIQARLGKFTASNIEKICKPKGFGETGKTYVREKLAELMTGQTKEIPVSKAMQWGIDNEQFAIEYFNSAMGLRAIKNDLVFTDKTHNLSGTPDAILPNRIGIEIKCPNTDTHIEFGLMDSGADLLKIAPEYYYQIQTYIHLTEFDKFYFVSYDPRVLETKRKMFIFTVERDEQAIELIKSRCLDALEILNFYLAKL